MKPNHALAYAVDCVSFLLQKLSARELVQVGQIVLFGSVARCEPTPDSDVDLFVETATPKVIEPRFRKIVEDFAGSIKAQKYWNLLGVRLPVSLKVGSPGDWLVLPAALREHGRVLFGPYRAAPATGRPLALVTWEKVADRTTRTNLYRNLIGYQARGTRRPPRRSRRRPGPAPTERRRQRPRTACNSRTSGCTGP